MAKYFCCPHCGNRELQSTTETQTQTTGKNFSAGKGCLGYLIFGPLGILCGLCGQGQQVKTTNTTYWLCNKCGTKFRAPDDIRHPSQGKTIFTLMFFMGIILGILFYVTFAMLGAIYDEGEIVIPAISLFIVAFCTAIGFALKKDANNKAEKAEKEARDLENAMARFNQQHIQISQNTSESIVKTNVLFKCSDCGASIDPTAAFCSRCGKRVGATGNTIGSAQITASDRINNATVSNNNSIIDDELIECVFCQKQTPKNQRTCRHCGRRQD